MDRAVDILHPLASLKWRECRGPPVAVSAAHAVWLPKDKVYVGGGVTSGSRRDWARLYIYSPATDTWTTLDTPVYLFGLTTYHSQLILVGGREYVGENVGGELTNKLWTLSEDGQWQETLPPMLTPCDTPSAVSHGDHLLVISGDGPKKVHVYNGHHWASTQHPPPLLYSMRSTVFNGHLYLMGGGGIVYSASLDSLLASCQPSKTSQPSSPWKRLTNVPSVQCCPAVFGNGLVAVGRRLTDTTTISLYAYSFHTQSWVDMGDAPISFIITPCAVLLPSDELMIVSGLTTCQSRLKLTPFDPESSFTMRAVSLLESAAGIPVMTILSGYTHLIQNIVGLSVTFNLDLKGVLNYWTRGMLWLRPSWRNLLLIVRLLHHDEVAQRMETFLSAGATEELSPTRGKQGDKEVDEQIRLRDDMIYQLKQQQRRIADLEYRNKEFEELSQISMEEEECVLVQDDQRDTKPFVHEEKLHVIAQRPRRVLIELKEKPLTLKGEPHALLSVKREIKEEAVPVTKAETTSAQSTTATWNLRGVEVCGEMTVVVHSSHGQQIVWSGYGLRLNIPKGCLPAGMEQCTINIKASLAGQYELPENSHLVSAIFWLRCEDVYKFTKPITVEIQHCAKSENIANLSFVRAVCCQEQLPYTFKQLLGGNFTSHSSYGVIELNRFSGVGVTQEGSDDREYCSRLFYMPLSRKIPNQEIDFVVSWNTEAHLTAIEIKYSEKGALVGPYQPVEFEADAISLDIPMEGLSIKGWEITPLIRPVVTKKQVDNFREGKLTPCCQLLAEVSGKVPTVKHRVNLIGAKYPNDVFVINLPAGETFGDLAAAGHPGPPPNNASEPSASGASTAGPSSANGLDTKLAADTNSQPAEIFGDLAAADRPGPPPSKRSRLDASEPSASGASTAGPSSASGLDTKLDLNTDHYKVASYLRRLDDRQIRYVGGALGLAFSTLDKMRDVPSEVAAAWLLRQDNVTTVSGEPTWRSLVNALRKEGQEGTARDIEENEK